jgi:hypothetical protein
MVGSAIVQKLHSLPCGSGVLAANVITCTHAELDLINKAAVGHHQFIELGEDSIKAWGQTDAVVYDVKSILPLGAADGRL